MLLVNETNDKFTMRQEIIVMAFSEILIFTDFAKAKYLKANPPEVLTDYQERLLANLVDITSEVMLQILTNRRTKDIMDNVPVEYIYEHSALTMIYHELPKWLAQSSFKKAIVLVYNDVEKQIMEKIKADMYCGYKIEIFEGHMFQFMESGNEWTCAMLKHFTDVQFLVEKYDVKDKTVLCAQYGYNFNHLEGLFECPSDMTELSIEKKFEFGYIELFRLTDEYFTYG